MSAEPETPHAAPKTHILTRRRVLTGAAWSVPVIAAAVAVPIASASGHTRQTYTVSVTGSGAQMATTTFTLPADATNIVYTVEGGNGAGYGSVSGGRGALLTGAISDTGTALPVTLTAAGGGLNGTSGNTHRRGDGGAGFGAGGSTPASPSEAIPPGTFRQANGGGGGGGSALHIGGDLAVVAGGGGGAGAAEGHRNTNNPSESLSVPREPHGGNADLASTSAPTASTYFTDGVEQRTLTVTGGGTGTASHGGMGGAGATNGYYAPTDRTAQGASGGSANAPADERGKGADALSWILSSPMSATEVYVFAGTSGGGGGGYTGGGSGGTAVGSWEYSHLVGIGSGGGGGGNFTASTAGGLAVSPAAPALRVASGMPGDGAPGKVTVTFDAHPGLIFP